MGMAHAVVFVSEMRVDGWIGSDFRFPDSTVGGTDGRVFSNKSRQW